MSGLGDMLEKKDFLIGCILRRLGLWDMAIKKLNLFQKKLSHQNLKKQINNINELKDFNNEIADLFLS